MNWMRLGLVAVVIAGLLWIAHALRESGRDEVRSATSAVAASAAVVREVNTAKANQAASDAAFSAQRIDAAASATQAEIPHVPLAVVSCARNDRPRAGTAVRSPVRVGAASSADDVRPQPGDGSADQVRGDGGAVRLSAGGVRLWNDALTGRGGYLPSDSCSDAEARGEACAAGTASGQPSRDDSESTELTLADAWINHTTNAASCARDRVRLDALTQLLRPYAASSLEP